jgi:hypothetical protein
MKLPRVLHIHFVAKLSVLLFLLCWLAHAPIVKRANWLEFALSMDELIYATKTQTSAQQSLTLVADLS